MSQQDFTSASFLPKGCGFLLLLMCLGLIDGIALPSFLAVRNRNKLTERKQYVSSMNKVQQAHFAQKSAFATSVDALGLDIKTEKSNGKYLVIATKKTAFNYGISQDKNLKNCVGGVFVVPTKNKITTISILCEADSPGTIKPAEPTYQNGNIVCGTETTKVSK
jgi:type IV pilus assembly protein PilA